MVNAMPQVYVRHHLRAIHDGTCTAYTAQDAVLGSRPHVLRHESAAITCLGTPIASVVSMEDVRLLEKLEEALDAADAIHEADRDGTISLAELRERLGR
jgi:threonine aldolase